MVSAKLRAFVNKKSAKGLATRLVQALRRLYVASVDEAFVEKSVMELNTTLSYLAGLACGAVSIWFFFWSYRRKYGLDYKLDKTEQTVRWLIVYSAFGVALVPGPQFKMIRIIAGIMLVAFLAWPNFAHYVTRLFRRS